MTPPVRIATRGSDLALWQARRVARLIEERCGLETELVIVASHGDKDGESPIERLGAVGVFTKELERALLEGEADIAVHSLKDLPAVQPPELVLAAIPERADPRDLLVARRGADIARARIGTSSKRREAQIRARFPAAAVVAMRGNVPTRVEKLRRGECDAIVLAAAGVERLGLDLSDLDVTPLPIEEVVPAPAQGAIAVEARVADCGLLMALERIDDREAAELVAAERRLLRLVEGGCTVPLGAHAKRSESGRIVLSAMLGTTPALVRAATPEAAAELAFCVLRPDPAPFDREAARRALEGRTVAILRDPLDAADLARELSELGARADIVPAIACRPIAPGELRAALAALPKDGFVLVASPRGAAALASEAGPEAFRTRRAGAVGAGTARVLARAGIPIDLLAEKADGAGLAGAFVALGLPRETPVLLPAAKDGRPELGDALRAAGYAPRVLAVYETEPLPIPAVDPRWDAILLASPSAARALPVAAFRAKLVAIGETTAGALRARGFPVAAVAARPTTAGMIEAIAAALARGSG
jgi:hydroxymethylbilane synthase